MFTKASETTFHGEFFPTPDPIIEKMIEPYTEEYIDRNGFTNVYLKYGNLLDPSAGTGAILDYCKRTEYRNRGSYYAVEINPNARAILSSKGYNVIGINFMEFSSDIQFGLVLMNPPFSQGAKHLLKAWEIVREGGHIACLLNQETLSNPYTRERQLLTGIIEAHGSIEWLGQAFKNAERPTDVNVALVRLQKPESDNEEINFGEGYEQEPEQAEQAFQEKGLALSGQIPSIVSRYNAAVEELEGLYMAGERIKSLTSYEGYEGYGLGLLSHNGTLHNKKDVAMKRLKDMLWKEIFNKTMIAERITSKVRKDFEKFKDDNKGLALTESNVKRVLEVIEDKQVEIRKACVLEVFDDLTKFHEQNRVHVEGWKSNDAWKVTDRRIIPPYGVSSTFNGKAHISYSHEDRFNDLDYIMCLFTGTPLNDYRSIVQSVKDSGLFGEYIYSEFFRIKCYQKGTIHLWPKDKKAIEDFNIEVAGYRGWLKSGEY